MAQPTLIPNCDGARFESLPLDTHRHRVEQTYAAPQGPRFCTTLALDLGTSTGWAIRGHDGLITSGTVSLRPGRFDGGGMRYLRFTNWLTEIDRLPPETLQRLNKDLGDLIRLLNADERAEGIPLADL